MKKILHYCVGILLMVLTFQTVDAHVWEIRVNQSTDGSLTWYVQSYHGLSECGIANSGININGVNYPLEQEFAGSIQSLSPTVFAVSGNYARGSYGVVHTPFLGTNLNVQPYSTNACWYLMVSGSGSFTPPPPPVCTSFPVTNWSNTVALPGNNNGTECDKTDDNVNITVTVNHQSCGSITGDGKFSMILDPGGANIAYGPYNYSTGITTNVPLNVPYGFNQNTQLQVVDNDFPGSNVTHGFIGIPGGVFNGVPDTTVPTVITQNLSIQLNLSGSTTISAQQVNNGSTDACGIASMTIDKYSFDCSNIGANTVTLTVTDVNGNVGTGTAIVTVNDVFGPSVAGTATVNIPSGGNTYGWSPWYSYFNDPLPAGSTITGVDLTYTAVDQGWGGTGAPSDMFVSGTYIGSGTLLHYSQTHTISYTGSVSAYVYGGSNNLQMNFWGYPGWVAYWQGGTITLHYTQAVAINGLSITKQLDASGNVTITADDVDPGFSDACGIASRTLSKSTFDCSNLGPNNVVLTVTDNHGNVTTCTAVVTIEDHVVPVAVAQNLTIQLDAGGNASITPAQVDNGSSDACGIASLVLDKTTFDCSNVGANIVTLTVTDNHGNVSIATSTITVEDHVAPVALAQDVTLELDANGSATVTAEQVDNGSSDACGIASVGLSKTAFDCSNVGANEVTLTVTDVHGNVSTATSNVTVQDNIAPALTVPANISQLNDAGVCGAVINIGEAVSSDNCSVASIVNDAPSFFNVGTTTVTWTVTDVNGNVTTETQTVEVTNNAPVISGLAVSPLIKLGDAVFASATHSDNNLVAATWNWGDESFSSGDIVGGQISGNHVYGEAGLYNVTLTIEDACGLTDTEVFSYVVIYNPCNGFLTGGGYINSPVGAYASKLSATGKANYGFEAKYNDKDGGPKGQFEFELKDSKFKVKSSSVEWLMINYDQAIMKGDAKVNESSGYHFIVSIIDGGIAAKNGTDYFRLIVWDDSNNVIYDNQNGDVDAVRASIPIGNGQIVIHTYKNGECFEDGEDDVKPASGGKKSVSISSLSDVGEFSLTVYPNPVVNREVNISIDNFGDGEASVEMHSMTGQIIMRSQKVMFMNGKTNLQLHHVNLQQGNYLLRVTDSSDNTRTAVKQIVVKQ